MNFTPAFITTLAALRAGAADLQIVRGEIALGKNKLSELTSAERTAQETIDSFLPTQIIAFDPAVADAFTQRRKLQNMRSGLNGSIAKLESRQRQLEKNLRHSFPAAVQEFKRLASGGRSAVVAKFGYNETIAPGDQLTESLNRGDLNERIAALLSLCKEFGAELPEAAS